MHGMTWHLKQTTRRIQKGNAIIIQKMALLLFFIFKLLTMRKYEVSFWIFYSLAEIIKRNQADGDKANNLRREVKGTATVV